MEAAGLRCWVGDWLQVVGFKLAVNSGSSPACHVYWSLRGSCPRCVGGRAARGETSTRRSVGGGGLERHAALLVVRLPQGG